MGREKEQIIVSKHTDQKSTIRPFHLFRCVTTKNKKTLQRHMLQGFNYVRRLNSYSYRNSLLS